MKEEGGASRRGNIAASRQYVRSCAKLKALWRGSLKQLSSKVDASSPRSIGLVGAGAAGLEVAEGWGSQPRAEHFFGAIGVADPEPVGALVADFGKYYFQLFSVWPW